MQEKIDVVLPVTEDSILNVLNNRNILFKNLPIKKIVLIGKKEIKSKIEENDSIKFIDEDKLLENLTINNIKKIKNIISKNERRSGWYFQQFLKMAYAYICKEQYYLIWDSDTIPVKKIDFFDEQRKTLFSI